MNAMVTIPPVWDVPREWPGARCFVIAGGESIKQQRDLIPKLKGRIIAIKEAVLLRPDADVLYLGGEATDALAKPLIPKFRGQYMVVRGKWPETLPASCKRLTRTKIHTALCDTPGQVAGYDSGTSAINLAYQFGATEIIVLGMDMCGGRWFKGEWDHPQMHIPEDHFRTHLGPLPDLAEDAKRKGIRIVNVSPISRISCFEKQPLEAFL